MCSLPPTRCCPGLWQPRSCHYSFPAEGRVAELLWSWKPAKCEGLPQRRLLWNGSDASCLSHAYFRFDFFRRCGVPAFPADCSRPFFFRDRTSFQCLYSRLFKVVLKPGPRAWKLGDYVIDPCGGGNGGRVSTSGWVPCRVAVCTEPLKRLCN